MERESSKPLAQQKSSEIESVMEELSIAFNSGEAMKSCVSTNEFEAILGLVKSFYDKMSSVVSIRLELKDKAKERLLEAKDKTAMPDEIFKTAVQKYKAMLWDADTVLYTNHGPELDKINEVTDFLNRFQLPEEMLPYLDVSFINRIKNAK